ncbi:MAG: ribonuclease H-like domain-containing protein, partial [Candidatus Limnocylindria bacterium]
MTTSPTARRSRTLADRLAAARGERASPPSPRAADDDRLSRLARWFDARTDVTENGTVLVVERTVAASPETVDAVAALPPAAYFDTETTGLSTGAGTVIFLAGIARVSDGRVRVCQYLLPDYPYEPPLLRAVAADLTTSPRIVTYNGRTFD